MKVKCDVDSGGETVIAPSAGQKKPMFEWGFCGLTGERVHLLAMSPKVHLFMGQDPLQGHAIRVLELVQGMILEATTLTVLRIPSYESEIANMLAREARALFK